MKFIHIMRHPYSNHSSLKRTDMAEAVAVLVPGGDILRLQLESRWIPHAQFALVGLAASTVETPCGAA
ncbi:MAG: hypothetical protein MRJ92_12665 [Nitrospira sp.]|nr:hypothetical protein [Nitrospira sp.]